MQRNDAHKRTKYTQFKTGVKKKTYPIYDQNGGKMINIDTQFMTKTAEKPYALGLHIPI